mmetsp:Transcript_10571/g.42668  ORF Transcript_10571/g.42668 Transcript_10571/m.42668 type:complete len:227 (+) Transcript_10571:386-1066(+)
MAGCLSANSTPHEMPNLIVAGDTILKIVLTTTPSTILMKKRVTISTYTSAHASARMTTRTPAVTLGSSHDKIPATRSAQLAASSRMFCDMVIIANTSSICFCRLANGLIDSQLNASFGALARSSASFRFFSSASRFFFFSSSLFSRSARFFSASPSSLASFFSSSSAFFRASSSSSSFRLRSSSASFLRRSSSSVGGGNGRPCDSHSSASMRCSTLPYRLGNSARE